MIFFVLVNQLSLDLILTSGTLALPCGSHSPRSLLSMSFQWVTFSKFSPSRISDQDFSKILLHSDSELLFKNEFFFQCCKMNINLTCKNIVVIYYYLSRTNKRPMFSVGKNDLFRKNIKTLNKILALYLKAIYRTTVAYGFLCRSVFQCTAKIKNSLPNHFCGKKLSKNSADNSEVQSAWFLPQNSNCCNFSRVSPVRSPNETLHLKLKCLILFYEENALYSCGWFCMKMSIKKENCQN